MKYHTASSNGSTLSRLLNDVNSIAIDFLQKIRIHVFVHSHNINGTT